MHPVIERIGQMGLVPVIAIGRATDAEPLAEALEEGGLPVAEVTFRTEAGRESIARIARSRPSMLLGAGTVLTVDQVKAAADAGARYIVSPGFNRKVVEYCLGVGMPITPGVVTPTEIETALEYGLEVVKFFPAEASGGLAYLRAVSAPYTMLKFIPTGGIDEKNLAQYLAFSPIHACGGSWMVKSELIASGRFDEIRKITARAVDRVLGFELRSVGIPRAGEQAESTGFEELTVILRLAHQEKGRTALIGNQSEDQGPSFGQASPHFEVSTISLHRAMAHLEQRGVSFDRESIVLKKGRPFSVQLEKKIEGFPVIFVERQTKG